MKRIFIDAGHNFSNFNTGVVGNGLREQDITFAVSYHLGKILEQAGLVVRLSRPTLETNLGTDNASAINARWQLSNFWEADLFISVHVNAGGGTGAEVIYSKDDSLEFARTVQDIYSTQMELRNRRVWHRSDIGVVRHANCPAILMELAFIDAPLTNPDVFILRNKQEEMAQALANGIFKYLGINPNNSKQQEEEEQMIKRFNTLQEMPVWAKPTISKLIEKGFLKGDGTGLDLSMDMIRIFVVNDQAGLY